MAVEKNKDADITAQTKPNQITARFHKIILSWDYFRLLSESQKISKDKGKIAALGLKKVKDTYKDIDDYIGTFEPLLFEEVKAHITQEKDEEEVRVWKQGVVMQCSEADGFHFPLVGHNHEDGISLAENDLVLLSNKELKEGSDLSSTTYAFALVLNREGNSQLKLCMFLAGEVQQMDVGNLKSSPRLLKMHSVVTTSEQRIVWMLKIANLSTIVREHLGLWSISSLPFKELILSASEKDANSKDQAWKIPRLLMEFLESNHNPSQLGAIRVGLSRKTFVLIQGPPGTGKTQTILGLLSAILHSTPARVQSKGQWCDQRRGPKLDTLDMYNHWKLASPWLHDTNPRDSIMPIDGDDGFFPTSGNELKPEVVQSNRKYRVRVLVCAPSNSALDEIVLRVLSAGIRDEGDRAYNPKIVRIGLKAHHSVKAVSLDYLVEQKLCGSANTADARKNGVAGGDRDSIRASVLDEAAIVFSTLSFSGSALFAKLKHAFDVVIIDEAAQAVEPATLIPLTNGCKQVFLVGDPVQLPATVISDVAKNFGYGTSLFKRLQGAGYPVQMLKTQYRMHPEIRHFPSREFYADSLEDGPDVKDQTERPWHNYRCFRPFCFFDIEDGVESRPSGSGSSWVNHDEVDFVLLMYQTLVTRYSELKSSSRIAIISPYAHQVKRFRHKFRENFGVDSDKLIDINTVDGFQGREKDVAIFSCVRANKGKGIGFVDDKRRMNVGITRARSSVLVVGSASTLKQDEHWRSLLESAEERNCLFKVSKPYKDFFSDGNLKTMYEPKEEAMEEVQDEGPGPGVIYNGDADGDGDGDGDGDADGGYAEDGDAYGDGGGYDED